MAASLHTIDNDHLTLDGYLLLLRVLQPERLNSPREKRKKKGLMCEASFERLFANRFRIGHDTRIPHELVQSFAVQLHHGRSILPPSACIADGRSPPRHPMKWRCWQGYSSFQAAKRSARMYTFCVREQWRPLRIHLYKSYTSALAVAEEERKKSLKDLGLEMARETTLFCVRLTHKTTLSPMMISRPMAQPYI